LATLTTSALTTGGHTITATFNANANYAGNSNTVSQTVNPGLATHFQVTPVTATPTAGSTFNYTVTAQDAYNNTATGYTGTVHFTSSDGQALLPANGTLTNGTGTFSATLNTSGSRTITATDT